MSTSADKLVKSVKGLLAPDADGSPLARYRQEVVREIRQQSECMTRAVQELSERVAVRRAEANIIELNRAENLRAIPRSDPDFARLYVRRGDAESVNRALEDTLYLNRAHSEGHLRQTADLLGFALMVNSLTLARHRAREAVKAARRRPLSAMPPLQARPDGASLARPSIPPRSRAR